MGRVLQTDDDIPEEIQEEALMSVKCPICKNGKLKISVDTAYTYRRVKNKGIMKCDSCSHREVFI